MRSLFHRAILIAALSLAPLAGHGAPETDAEVAAHEAALDLAGAFTNDGFKLRDGDYEGTLQPGQSVLVQVNLYAGNEYWFSAATSDPKAPVAVSLYDETGKLLKSNPYTDAHRAAAGFSPDNSGPYYVRVTNPGAAATYCLIYSYK